MKFALNPKKSPLRHTIAREDGLTLLEVALALVILSIVSLYFLSYFTNSTTQSKLTNQRLSATHLANARLHEIQDMEFTVLQTWANRPPGALPNATKDIYLLTTEISDRNSKYASNPDILYITVTAYWQPDPSQGAGKYRHKVSITGAVKKNYAAASTGGITP
ncbi:type II secretion system GspH family protein [Paenibacillus sp. MBLB2552]|uniref:Type II secretion system GspH family protein n=1 Tax=Paenibacillus mellifer TaxID=2937794 RepID=A0A9X1Y4V1_9BACL|nr:type II secretion system protein [Paenibacillus mellifer]MCK8487342.1 type II secretion system GspH family protein [Paenibacillus mellifer]